MKKYKKGSYGYINALKKSRLIQTLSLFGIVLIILLVGFLLNNNSKNNYFTIFSVLMVLPATKVAIGYIILIPFRSIDKRKYDEVKSLLPEKSSIYTDVVITSTEKIMNLDFLVILGSRVLGLKGSYKQDLAYINQYLIKGIKDRGFLYECAIYGNEKEFYKAIQLGIEKELKESTKELDHESIRESTKELDKDLNNVDYKELDKVSDELMEQKDHTNVSNNRSSLDELIDYLESLMI